MKYAMGRCEFEAESAALTLHLRESNEIGDDAAALRQRLEEDGYLLLRGLHDRDAVLGDAVALVDNTTTFDFGLLVITTTSGRGIFADAGGTVNITDPDSMIDALINDGDLVIMRHQETAEDGDMVAAWLVNEQETTLKRYYHEGERVRLQPENSQMKPIYVAPDNLQIQGKVLAVVRQVS